MSQLPQPHVHATPQDPWQREIALSQLKELSQEVVREEVHPGIYCRLSLASYCRLFPCVLLFITQFVKFSPAYGNWNQYLLLSWYVALQFKKKTL